MLTSRTLLRRVSYPRGSLEYYAVNSWLFFQTSGIGPMQGQATHFVRFAPERHEYSLFRYQTENRRLYRVLDTHLAKSSSGYLVGDRCSIADIALWPWIVSDFWAGIDIEPYEHLKKWEALMMSRPGVANGRHKPDPHFMKELAQDPELQKVIEREAGKWIQGLQNANGNKWVCGQLYNLDMRDWICNLTTDFWGKTLTSALRCIETFVICWLRAFWRRIFELLQVQIFLSVVIG